MPKYSASPTGAPCGWPWMKKVVPCPGTYSMAKVSPSTSLLRPEKISTSRLLAGVWRRICSGVALADRPLINDSPRSVPGRSRSATKLRRTGPLAASTSSAVRTLCGRYSAMSYTLKMAR